MGYYAKRFLGFSLCNPPSEQSLRSGDGPDRDGGECGQTAGISARKEQDKCAVPLQAKAGLQPAELETAMAKSEKRWDRHPSDLGVTHKC